MTHYTIQDYYNAIDRFAPFSLAMEGDNPGLLIGSGEQPVKRALVALDATIPVIEEAARRQADLIVTHHPVIYQKLGKVPADSPVYQAIRQGIGVISAHTNLDIAQGGVNDLLAQRLELEELELLEETGSRPWRKVIVFVPREAAEEVYTAMTQAGAGWQGNYRGAAFLGEGEGRFLPVEGANPSIGAVGRLEKVSELRLEMLVGPDRLGGVLAAMKAAHPYEEPAFDVLETHSDRQRQGLGRVGTLSQGRVLSPEELARFVKDRLGVGGLKYVSGGHPITRVAVCGGSGTRLASLAKALGAQALVAGDSRHSELLDAARMGITLIDAGHYATEAVAMPALQEQLLAALPRADIQLADACQDPALYLAD